MVIIRTIAVVWKTGQSVDGVQLSISVSAVVRGQHLCTTLNKADYGIDVLAVCSRHLFIESQIRPVNSDKKPSYSMYI